MNCCSILVQGFVEVVVETAVSVALTASLATGAAVVAAADCSTTGAFSTTGVVSVSVDDCFCVVALVERAFLGVEDFSLGGVVDFA